MKRVNDIEKQEKVLKWLERALPKMIDEYNIPELSKDANYLKNRIKRKDGANIFTFAMYLKK